VGNGERPLRVNCCEGRIGEVGANVPSARQLWLRRAIARIPQLTTDRTDQLVDFNLRPGTRRKGPFVPRTIGTCDGDTLARGSLAPLPGPVQQVQPSLRRMLGTLRIPACQESPALPLIANGFCQCDSSCCIDLDLPDGSPVSGHSNRERPTFPRYKRSAQIFGSGSSVLVPPSWTSSRCMMEEACRKTIAS
jgi:hypothetical protein